jgi:KUP system potassium uptake protein
MEQFPKQDKALLRADPINRQSIVAIGFSALGIVFGDIGTNPLYTLKTVLDLTGGTPTLAVVLGVYR